MSVSIMTWLTNTVYLRRSDEPVKRICAQQIPKCIVAFVNPKNSHHLQYEYELSRFKVVLAVALIPHNNTIVLCLQRADDHTNCWIQLELL